MLIINNEFVTQWKPLVYQILGRRGRKYTKEEMDDLFVEVVIEMMKNAHYYNDEYAIGTWIDLQVRSVMSAHVKAEAKGKDSMAHVVTSEIPDEAEELDSEDVQYAELQEQVTPYLKYLDPAERDIFIDRLWHDISVPEIAERRELHEKSVSRIINRAVKKLSAIVSKGFQVNRYEKVYSNKPLEHVIKVYDDAHYHTFRMHHLEGLSLSEIQKVNGMPISRIQQLLRETKQYLQLDYGVTI